MAIVKVEKNTYTVEPLYQWDMNQVLEIRGLSMAATPEVHFTNDAMVRAVRRFATMDVAGVIRAEVPNALLQTAGKVKALVCIREGEIFKTYHEIRIPVKARPQPADYTITDDQDVYSFLELENLVYETAASIEGAVQAAEAASAAAAAAQEKAEAAQATAEAAQATADSIAATAEAAQATAEAAQAAAESANTTAGAAMTAAEEAKGEAEALFSEAVRMKLLWQNATPGSEFAAQTISLDLSGYDYVAIDYRANAAARHKMEFCKIGENCHLDCVCGSGDNGLGGASVLSVFRQAEVSSTAVVFTKGLYTKQNSTSVTFTEANLWAIPHRIYGIKGVIV